MRNVSLALAALFLLWFTPACPGDVNVDDDTATPDDDDSSAPADDDDTTPPPMESLFSIAVLADPHVTGPGANEERLIEAVGWINDNASDRNTQLVVVLGDVAWNDGFDVTVSALDELVMPWAPVIGDNAVNSDDEQAWDEAFASQYDVLSVAFEDFVKTEMPVHHPAADMDVWFNQFAFTHVGVRFVALDWCARGVEGVLTEMGDLHDFDGGTLRFLQDDLAAYAPAGDHSLIMLSHIPMHLGGFDLEEMDALSAVLEPYADQVWANLAGHLHLDYEYEAADSLYWVYVTDAVWDDDITIRMIAVEGNGEAFEYTQELVVL
jgi:hypothetical protein